jgi:coenzyme F420-reducing hydrogenase delta subunit
VALLTEVLKQYGIGEERFWLRWIAASEGTMLKEIAVDMTAKLKQLGPSPLGTMGQMAV